MKKKVLVIGGTGTISTPVTKTLDADANVDLYVLNRGKKMSLAAEPYPANDVFKNATLLTADSNNAEELKAAVADLEFDAVVNFTIFKPEVAQHNVDIFTGKTKQFIFISTVAALNHEDSCNVTEETPYGNRFSQYGQNKAACEKVFLAAQEKGFPLTIVRPTQTYSKNRLPLSVKGKSYWEVIQRMIDGKEVIVHGDGQSVWASTHAKDFAKGFVPLVGNKKAVGEIFQIMNDKPHTFDMVYKALAKELGVEYKPVYIPSDVLSQSKKYDFMTAILGDKRASNIFDCSKIKEFVPEFKCDIDIEEGVKQFLAFMDKHPHLKKADPEFSEWCDNVIAKYKESIKAVTEIV